MLRSIEVYKSDSAGVKNWVFPSDHDMKWSDSLTAISTNGNYEFNFVFKNGKTSNAPMSGSATEVEVV